MTDIKRFILVEALMTYTLADVRALDPCYDPGHYLPEDWRGTVQEILSVETCSAQNRLWVVTRLIDERMARLFAVRCARRALDLSEDPNAWSFASCNVAERYANGEATEEELAEARALAWSVAEDTAAWHASRAAFRTTDMTNLGEACFSAAAAAAWAEASVVSETAAEVASPSGDGAPDNEDRIRIVARDKAWDVAIDVAWNTRLYHLREMLILIQ